MVKGVVSVAGFVQGRWTGALGLNQRLTRMGALGDAMIWLINKMIFANENLFSKGLDAYAADANAMHNAPDYDVALSAMYMNAKQIDWTAMHYWFDRVQNIDISAGLSTITVPTLVMVGDKDPIVPPEQARIIHAGVPHSEYIEYSGVGHMLMWERHRQYHHNITVWLKNKI
jgi:pimeloyl-ACP methyl ester carboxylesterase